MISRKGVCYDLTITPYTLTIGDLTYCFSSQLHLEKFQERMKENRDMINYSLTKRFKFHIDVSTLADVVLYQKIETRGFLIVKKDEEITCLKHITLNGAKVTLRNSKG